MNRYGERIEMFFGFLTAVIFCGINDKIEHKSYDKK